MNTCAATHRKIVRSWGTATEFGHKACGAPATKVRQVKQAHGDYTWPVYSCDDHARPTDEDIVTEEPAEVMDEPAAEVVEVATPTTECPALAEPGNIHLMTVHCIECNAYRMAKMNRDTVEQWYRSGHFGQEEYEAYMYVWATSAVRHSAGGWGEEPTDPKVIELAAAIRRHAGIPAPAVLAA
ncbi:hypothetical protein [Streptomyces sp. NPDC004528]|uniref:hypothetical protein n=1 Tax=Streptomyces sp. NPDC004528 TaxID=3154550 RepID=UPI0033BA564E